MFTALGKVVPGPGVVRERERSGPARERQAVGTNDSAPLPTALSGTGWELHPSGGCQRRGRSWWKLKNLITLIQEKTAEPPGVKWREAGRDLQEEPF